MYSKVSIVLFVKGRTQFTRRWLNYMSAINFKYPIIIADGDNKSDIAKILKKKYLKKLKINYLKFNTHSGNQSYLNMLSKTINRVRTEYVMVCDNDDFILPSGLDFLLKEINEKLISISGIITNFNIDNYKFKSYGKNFFYETPYKYYDELENGNSIKNLRDRILKFQPNFYNIFRTKILKKIYKEASHISFSDLQLFELFIILRAHSLGKSKIIKNASHYLRQRGTSQISNNYEFSRELLKKNMPQDIRKIAKFFSKNCKVKTKNLKEMILDGYSNYLNNYLGYTTLRYRFPKMYKIKLFFITFFEQNFFAKKIHIFFLNLKSKKVFNKYYKFRNKKDFLSVNLFLNSDLN